MYGKLLILFSITASLGMAEFNPFGGSTIIQPSGSGSSIANGIINKTVHSGSEVIPDSGVDANGREYKAQAAVDQAKTGQGIAVATGITLVTTGAMMMASIIPSVRAAGKILMIKGGMEFGQAGANGKSADLNQAQKNLLTNNGGATGSQATAASIASKLNNPELDKLLADRGINGDDFKRKIASGDLNDVDSISQALGDTSETSPEDMAAGEAIAANKLSEISSSTHDDAALNSIGFNEAAGGKSGDEKADSFGSSSIFAAGSGEDAKAVQTALVPSAAANSHGAIGVTVKTTGGDLRGTSGPNGELPFDSQAMLASLLGKGVAPSTDLAKDTALLRATLEQNGILVPTSKQHIFQVAHRNFKSFGKWRKTIRIAAARPIY